MSPSSPSQPFAERASVLLAAIDDTDLAVHSEGTLLITGSSPRGVETLARHVHGGGRRAPFPFVHQRARELPLERESLREHCSLRLADAAGGSLLISDVEEMLPVVQDILLELLAEDEWASRPSTAAVRLMSGTTVWLFDRVAAGSFSARLFYRLNVIHLVAEDGAANFARA